MSDIINTYPVFESNQVLTSKQLNNLVNYLDQQNRLTRARLIGMGVICGLEVSYDATGKKLTISKGTGITSEGYLINIGECITVKYRPYKLPAGTIYEPFVNSNNEQDIKLLELLTESAEDGPEDLLLDDSAFLNDKVVLLFIESFDKDLKSCLGKSCDELGKERILTLRKLLISKTDLQKVWNRTNTGKLDAVFPEKFKLPVINLPRVLFNPDKSHSKSYKDFSKNYADAVLVVFDKLIDALAETYDIYRPLLLKSYGEKNPFTDNPLIVKQRLAKIQNFLNDADATLNSYHGVQYVYDLFLDLILAYNEFKNTAFDLMSECCADMSRFPKHLMIGEAIPSASAVCEKSEFRHHFVQPPVYNLQKLLVQRTISLHNRMVLMIEMFDIKKINTAGGIEIKKSPIRVTPSFEKTTLLSQRSIPWYYNVNKSSSYSALGTLQDYWNFDVSRKCIPETEGLVLNYDDQLNDQSVAKSKLETPLFYDINDYPFLRIEGQTGFDFEIALERINKLKTQFNLPFNTLALQLDTNAETLALDYKCGFEDIQEEYRFLRLSFCRFTSDIRELYKFVSKNQEVIFGGEKEGEKQSEFLKKLEEIVESLGRVCKSMPECFPDFNFGEFQKGYKALLESIIDFILIDLKLLEKINVKKEDAEKQVPLINGFIQRLSPIVSKIADMVFYNRFLRLYHSFKRREFYLKKTTGVFSNYIRKHPGIEHQAGVPKGGTFIMVYENNKNKTVFADFNLPYLCCTTDNCVPMCDEEGGFVFDIEPFARPDYAITLVDFPVDIDVLRNDSGLLPASYAIKSDEVSKFGGIINQNSEQEPLNYSPPKGFSGTDFFEYQLFNARTGASDKARVTVVVKKPDEPVKTCYSVDILQCWGDKSVLETIRGRGINFSPGDNIFEVLLNDLRKTGGFTEDEIKGSVLEDEERRRQLLSCLDIPFGPNTTYEQLGQLILDYQKSNCGSVQPVKQCYTIEILKCWGDAAVKDTVSQRELDLSAGADMFEVLLIDLRKTGGFTEDEITSSVLEEEERRRQLLSCVGIKIGPNTTYEQLGQMILDYQKSNCGAVQPVKECYSVEILQCWGDQNVQRMLKIRGLEPSGNIFQQLLNSLRETKGFTQNEMQELNDARIEALLKCLGINVVAGVKPIELLNQYQSANCQSAVFRPAVAIDTNLIPATELVKVLETRGIKMNANDAKENLEKALAESSGGNELSEPELMVMSRDSLVNILNNRNILNSVNENKTQLVKKLFKRG
ncbi:MAG: hypothetical protein EP310_08615 [Bacteroidetes bacterium]|nr:MAG: hypothetical protein EP310_08615 [Bacteroidota bacterium]